MLNFILGGAGSGKSVLLSDKIKEKVLSGKKVIVIVPEQFSFDSDKKLYRKLGCSQFNKILSCSFTSIAREIFEKYGTRSGEYADDVQKLIIMQQTVKMLMKDKQLRYFARQASKPDFISELIGIVTEFRRSGVSADNFTAKMTGDNVSFSEKISDLSLIYFTYNRILEENNLKDSLTDISEAAAIAEMNDFFENTAVFFDEFESFNGDQYQLIESIISRASDVYISLRLEMPIDNKMSIFDSVKSTWSKFDQLARKYNIEILTTNLDKPVKYKSPDLAHLNVNILRPVRKRFGISENIRIAECTDLYEEADWICSEIKRIVRESDYKYRDITVTSRQLSEYIYIFETAFEKYDIPFSIDVKKSIMHTSIMQYVSGILGAVSQREFSSEMIFRYAKTHLSGISQSKISDIENYCFEWNIDGKKWSQPFEAGIKEHPFVEQTRQEIILPLSKLRKNCTNTDSKGICTAVYDFMTEMNVQKRIAGIINEFRETGLEYLASEFKRIWNIFIEILDKIANIGGEMSVSEFENLFIMIMKQVSYSVPPQTLDGVNIICAETARPDNPKIVFIAGVNEGLFPPGISQSGILSEKDRMIFEKSGISLSRKNEELIADERLIVYKTLTHASEQLYISYPLADNSGGHRFRSYIINQINDMFDNDIIEFANKKSIIDYCSTPKAAYVNIVRYFGENSKETQSIRKVLEQNQEYSAKIKYLEKVRQERTLAVSDKNLMRELYTQRLNLSATAIEEYNLCHFKYFCHNGLKLKVRRKRVIDKIGEGNLTHICLEEILRSCTKEEFDNLNHEQIYASIKKSSQEFLKALFDTETVDMPEVNTSIQCISENIEELIKHLQKELKQSEFRPAAFELDISRGNDNPVLKTSDGIEIYLRGSIDRVDVLEKDGKKYLRVIDYKTGKKNFSISSLLYGLNMQMLLYLFSITGKKGAFSDYEPAGVLYMPSGGAMYVLDRNTGEAEIEKHLSDHYKMNGVVLKDRLVLNAMEKEIKGIFIPASLLKADSGSGELKLSKSSSCFTRKNFEKLREYTDSILLKMCEEIYNGNIQAEPFVEGNKAPCNYCDYWSVCGNTNMSECRVPAENAEEIMMEIIGGADDEQMD